MKKLLILSMLLTSIFLTSCNAKNNNTNNENSQESTPEQTQEDVYNQKVVDSKYLASEADCTHPAKYYYSSTTGKIGTETFESGEALGHNYVNKICTRCNLYNDGEWNGEPF